MDNTNKKTDNTLYVELLNLDKTTNNTLRYYLGSNLCPYTTLSDSSLKTNLFIYDISQKYDPKYLQFIDSKSQYIIILYLQDNVYHIKKKGNTLFLQKPIDTTKLKELILIVKDKVFKATTIKAIKERTRNSNSPIQLSESTTHTHLNIAVNGEMNNDIHERYKAQKYVGSNKDITLVENYSGKIFITEKNYLYHTLINAKNKSEINQSYAIIHLSTDLIIYDYKNQIFLYNLLLDKLKYYQCTNLSNCCKVTLTFTDTIELYSGYTNINDSDFIWDSSIQASKGRLPQNTDITSNITLLSWPNFSRLHLFRYAVQIASVWANNSLSLFETARQLQIPQRYVFTLYTAMDSLGHIKHEFNSTAQTSIKSTNKPSIFAKIIAHLFN